LALKLLLGLTLMLSWSKNSPAKPTSLLPWCGISYSSGANRVHIRIQADCDDLGAAKATLEGLKKRHALGVVPIFIHTVSVNILARLNIV
jgi:hypothetical protein